MPSTSGNCSKYFFFFLIAAFTLVLRLGFCDVNLLLDGANSKPDDI